MNGDHKSPQNEWRVAFVCHDNGEKDVKDKDYAVVSGISGVEGSRPQHYQTLFVVPEPCEREQNCF